MYPLSFVEKNLKIKNNYDAVIVEGMVALIIEKSYEKTLVVGPIYDKIELLESHKKLWEQQELIIFNGNLCYPNDNLDQIEKCLFSV